MLYPKFQCSNVSEKVKSLCCGGMVGVYAYYSVQLKLKLNNMSIGNIHMCGISKDKKKYVITFHVVLLL